MMDEMITSLQNPRIKNVMRLSRAGGRRGRDMIAIEGCREIRMALGAGVAITELYAVGGNGLNPEAEALARSMTAACRIVPVARYVFEKMAYRDNTDGLLALAVPPRRTLGELRLGPNPLLVVLESPEKPGNIGAILRTADAAGADAVIVCDEKTDLYNPNVIRASLGCVFTLQTAACALEDAIAFLKRGGIQPYAASPAALQPYYDAEFEKPSAIVLGSETDGLSRIWLEQAAPVTIPMSGKADSLNLSAAAAILIFEAKRKRDIAAAVAAKPG